VHFRFRDGKEGHGDGETTALGAKQNHTHNKGERGGHDGVLWYGCGWGELLAEGGKGIGHLATGLQGMEEEIIMRV